MKLLPWEQHQGSVLSGDTKDVCCLMLLHSLSIETLGGVATPLIEKTQQSQHKNQGIFTAEDNQSAVTVHVIQGERKQANQNKSLGQFNLEDIPPALEVCHKLRFHLI